MNYFDSTAFTECIHRHKVHSIPTDKYDHTLLLRVNAPQLRFNQQLLLVGNRHELGAWNPRRGIKMLYTGYNEWCAVIDALPLLGSIVEFKFVVVTDNKVLGASKSNSRTSDVAPIWEERQNRKLLVPPIPRGRHSDMHMGDAWFNIPADRMAGTAVPVFALRTKGSFGVGDFGDLKAMIEWVALTGQHVLQLLPINDTTLTGSWTESYPYSAISIYALHPMYCDLRQLPPLADDALMEQFDKEQKELNALSQIDYERVNKAKRNYLHLSFLEQGKKVLGTKAFKDWFKEEQFWLEKYAEFCILRDAENHVSDVATRQEYYYIQYLLAKQMKEAHAHAREHFVILKGDIPIGVSRYGCDAWQEPRYFNMNGQAGAPPDDFSANGQNWGFPTYNWDEMLKDGGIWWQRRFQNMAKYFDAYRIDHVLGFFRIWEIPTHSVHGLLGQFQPALGMTVDEIRAYGLQWHEQQYLNPLITDWIVDRWCPVTAVYVKETFLEKINDDHYRFKEQFDTQRKVEAYFNSLRNDKGELTKEQEAMRDTLYALISNVLFLRDHKNPELFHPRIAAQFDPCYEALWDEDKSAFNNLYNDYFYRRNNQFWYEEAMKKLPMLVDATKMLVCAEDLGMVPDCVAWVMDQLKILSLEIQSMPKDSSVRFGELNRNPFLSVCTISSHDTATMRMWWDEDEARTQDYYNNVLFHQGPAPHPMSGALAEEIVKQHLDCPSMLCILTLQDWLAMDEQHRLPDANAERINIPANPRHYWRYRMHLNIEDLMQLDDFNTNIRRMIEYTRP